MHGRNTAAGSCAYRKERQQLCNHSIDIGEENSPVYIAEVQKYLFLQTGTAAMPDTKNRITIISVTQEKADSNVHSKNYI